MLDTYRKIFDMFDARERRLFVVLMAVMVLVAFAELLGVSAVFMLLGVLAQPEQMRENAILARMFETMGFADRSNFQMFLAVIALFVVIMGLAVKAAGTYAIIRFAAGLAYTTSSRMLSVYLHQPYSWVLTRNSSDTSHRALTEVDRMVHQVILPSLRLLSSTLLSIAVVGFLIAVDPLVSFLSAILLCGGYGSIYLLLRRRLQASGKEMLDRGADRYRVVNELSGGFREVKLLGIESYYMSRYDKAASRYARTSAILQIMSEVPRFVLEALTFSVLLVLVFVLLLRNDGNLLTTIPTLGVFAYAVMRLLPAMQQIYHGLVSMRAHSAALNLIHGDIMDAQSAVCHRHQPRPTSPEEIMKLTKRLELRDVSYAYPNTSRAALSGVDLKVPACKTVGLVGGTGAGKTTLVDLILGLLTPDAGEIQIDCVAVTDENRRAWQRTVGYVPQSIYLTDDTVAANIAFGIPPEEIDMAAVERAASLAALHDFIVSELPDGYRSIVGERGIRLSGGQRQRIGIARALYYDPTVLILDEATSALDNITERVVMEAIASLRDDKTIIIIAHRLTTVRDCDIIFMMERGRLVAQGSYDDLVAGNQRFREMALGKSTA